MICHLINTNYLLAFLISAAWIAYAQLIVQNKNRLRIRRVTTSLKLWKLQFALHPLIVAVGVYFGITSSENVKHTMLLLSPFVFNFGVEPWTMPTDLLFKVLFYLHHIAPLLACCETDQAPQVAVAQAMLFGHLWMLHLFFSLEQFNIMSKQLVFWPYMGEGAVLFSYYWWCFWQSESTMVTSLPLLVQLAGRWGLYLRLLQLSGFPKPGEENFDLFEIRKQPVELAALVLSGVIVPLVLVHV